MNFLILFHFSLPAVALLHDVFFLFSGKDVSALFPDVVNCMQTDNLELKKLVYLYLMNYAKSQPDMAIMAVNTFVKVGLTELIFSYCTEGCLVANLISLHHAPRYFKILIYFINF